MMKTFVILTLIVWILVTTCALGQRSTGKKKVTGARNATSGSSGVQYSGDNNETVNTGGAQNSAPKVRNSTPKRKGSATGARNNTGDPGPPPEMDWGKCPQLAPTKTEAQKKTEVAERCLKQHPIPKEINENTVKAHNKKMVECALKAEKWFDRKGMYRFSRTIARITAKKLPKAIETELKEHVNSCRTDAQQKFPKKEDSMDLIQYFQSCMNFHTTRVCDIKVKTNTNNN